MTEQEFYDWLEGYHGARFEWLSKYFDGQDNPQETKRAWFGVLKTLPIQSVRLASDAMFADEQLAGKSIDKHPSILRRLATTAAHEAGGDRFPKGGFVTDQNGQQVYAFHCHFCEDSGFVIVWTQAALKCYTARPQDYREGSTGHWILHAYVEDGVTKHRNAGWCYHHATIRCRCERGQAFGRAWCSTTFDPTKHARVFRPEGGTWEDSLVNFRQFMERPKAVAMGARELAGYDPDRGW